MSKGVITIKVELSDASNDVDEYMISDNGEEYDTSYEGEYVDAEADAEDRKVTYEELGYTANIVILVAGRG